MTADHPAAAVTGAGPAARRERWARPRRSMRSGAFIIIVLGEMITGVVAGLSGEPTLGARPDATS